jgi:hypothetical protein
MRYVQWMIKSALAIVILLGFSFVASYQVPQEELFAALSWLEHIVPSCFSSNSQSGWSKA